jgi:hypothetical protein
VNMNMKMVVVAVVGGLCAGAVQAVNLNSYAGEVALVPYYTARNDQNTYLSIVNTTNTTKAIKVRFLEAYNSREVLDFNLYMSPFDVWTAAVQPTGKGGAKVYTQDNSCTVPLIPAEGEPFRTFAFDGRLPEYPLDGGPTGLDRTMEGHIEIIEMGVANDNNLGNWDWDGDGLADSTHIDGVPQNCENLVQNWKLGKWKDLHADTLPPTGGLFGTASVINVQKGTEFDVPVSMLEAFSAVNLHYSPGDLQPNLSHANPPISTILTSDNQIVVDTWATGIEAVSAALMVDTVVQEYTVNPAVEAGTSWVVTMPTKHYHVDLKLAPLQPFTEYFGDGESCDDVAMLIFDREEDEIDKVDDDFSPMPAPKRDQLCHETNVINFRESDFLGSENVTINVETPFKNGWMAMEFASAGNRMISKRNTYYGLPVIGFKATLRGNSNVGIGAAYATSSEHRYNRVVSATSGE